MTWSDFRWENGYSTAEPLDSLREPVRFDRVQYEAELGDADRRIADLPEAEPLLPGRAPPQVAVPLALAITQRVTVPGPRGGGQALAGRGVGTCGTAATGEGWRRHPHNSMSQ